VSRKKGTRRLPLAQPQNLSLAARSPLRIGSNVATREQGRAASEPHQRRN
jgi:hypothetical protein